MKDKKATITEQGNGESASVNNLSISNKSKDTVFLMAGDIITGGKQDRIVAEDMVINPGDKNVSIPVFCVEPHRWTTRGGDNQFRGSGKSVSNKVRGAAVISKDQTTVWGKVAEVTTKNDATTSSGTYNAIDENKEYAKDRGEYETFFKDKFSTTQDIIGVIAMSGDTVLGCDIFGSSNLFKSQYPSLVYAYITDAITYGDEKPFNPTKVNDYYKNRLTKRYFAKDDDEIPMIERGIPDSINLGEFNNRGIGNPKKSKNKNGLKFKKGEKILHYSDL
ncbi:MAG: hypothetical protein NTX03_12455 [Bacteroidetes bacterium]|nr:hypothetical protein [Bacteroidota bacterium]